MQGCGVLQSDSEAEKWWLLAAGWGSDASSVRAQNTLGMFYAREESRDLSKVVVIQNLGRLLDCVAIPLQWHGNFYLVFRIHYVDRFLTTGGGVIYSLGLFKKKQNITLEYFSYHWRCNYGSGSSITCK